MRKVVKPLRDRRSEIPICRRDDAEHSTVDIINVYFIALECKRYKLNSWKSAFFTCI